MEKPGRNLRNLGGAWEPLRGWTAIADGVGDAYGPARQRSAGRGGEAAPGERTCTDRAGTVYVPPPPRRVDLGQQRRRGS